jgi:hypothetical protein
MAIYRSRASGERAKQLPVPSFHESFLLRGLQSGYPLLWKKTSEGVRGILHERFHPAGGASRFPEGRRGRLVEDCQKMVVDGLAGQGEGWPVPFVVKFQMTGGKAVAKEVIGTC